MKLALVLPCLILNAGAVHAQRAAAPMFAPAQQEAEPTTAAMPQPRGHAFLPALLGSAAGAFVGWHIGKEIGELTRCCETSEDQELPVQILGAAALSAAAGATSVLLTTHTFATSDVWASSVIGLLPAAGAAALGSELADGSGTAALVSFAIVHAAFITVVTPR